MKHSLLCLFLLMGIIGCTGNTDKNPEKSMTTETKEAPSTGVSVSGYARFGVEKGP